MKILVILVLVFLTGCNGGQYDHPSRCQVKMAQDAYWDYVQKSTLTPKDYVWDIRHSHPGQYLCSLISHSVETVQKFFRLVYTHIVMWSTHFYHRFCQEVDHLQQHLHDFLHHLEYDIHFHAKELVAQIRWQLEGIKILAGHYIEALDPRGLKMALLEKLKELNEHLKRCFELLETHHHFTQTTYDLNKKIVPRSRSRVKLNKASDSLQDDLEFLWEDWAQSQKKVD
uniref:Uncharacterized protein n=1 Tax=Xiphophorus couchianus TaxID=32473 RepID=A0A3B5L1V1_9TELE